MSATDKELEKIPELLREADKKLREFVKALVKLEKVLDETGLDGFMNEDLAYALALTTKSGEQIEFNYCGIILPHTNTLFAEEIGWEELRREDEKERIELNLVNGYNKKTGIYNDIDIPSNKIETVENIYVRKERLK